MLRITYLILSFFMMIGVTFAGEKYGTVEFGLDDRSRMGTDVLLNRKLMSRLNVIVNPQRKYVVTTPFQKEV